MKLLLAAFAIFGIAVFIRNILRRREEDAIAFYWASLREPLVFIQETPFDDTVKARHAEAVANLEKYGNGFLKPVDVWLYVYRVDVIMSGQVDQINFNHSQWYDMVLTQVARRKAEWRELKSGWIGGHAASAFGGQKTNNN